MHGCVEPTQFPVWTIDEYQFHICPINFLSPQIKSWFNHYKQIKDGICSKVNYGLTNAKFFEAINIYENYLNNCNRENANYQKEQKTFKVLKDASNARRKNSI